MLLKPSQRHLVYKGWGWEDWIYNEQYCGKRLFFNQSKCCSWHYHKIKDEVLFLDYGKIILYYSLDIDINKADIITLHPGDAFHIEPNLIHRMYAKQDSMIFEVSTHHEDSDSIVIEKGD